MPAPRELTDAAIDCAIHGLPEPKNGWRNHLPPEDLGAMVDNGSGQISLQALVAALHYDRDKTYATATLRRYAELCPKRFMLSEPWSLIYGTAIFSCWAAVVLIAERSGNRTLGDLYRGLLARWAGTCALMESGGKVLAAGARCWGHEVHGGGWDNLWAIAAGRKNPPRPGSNAYGKPGAYDDWGWLGRCSHLAADIFRSAAAPFLGRDWRSLLPAIPRWGARTEMQLLGWEDGSRLWLMGDDEAAVDDEDENSNTPGFLAAGVLGRKIVTLPRYPTSTRDGKGNRIPITRLRQTNCRADLDGGPATGWSLWHSHLGDQVGAMGGMVSLLPAYTASPLAFWVECPKGSTVWHIRVPGEVVFPGTVPAPTAPPAPAPPDSGTIVPTPRRRRARWWEFWR